MEDRPLDEQKLVARAKRGELDAYEEIVRLHQTIAFRTAWVITRSDADAEEATQDGFVKAHAALARFRDGAPFRPWLLAIVANEARNRRRSAGRYLAALTRAFRNEPTTSASTEERSARHMESSELWKAVQNLSVPDQQIIYLRYFLELSVTETAQSLGVAEGTVKSRLSRALERLHGIIQQDFPVLAEGHEGREA